MPKEIVYTDFMRKFEILRFRRGSRQAVLLLRTG
jgi:hypothetical protein